MHETSLATKLVAASLQEARRRGLRRVQSIRVRVGALWGMAPESLEFHMNLQTQGTALEGATLNVQTVPVVARCQGCGREVQDTRLDSPAFLHTLAHGPILVEALLRCAHCEGGEVSIQQGRELEIVEMTAAANPSQAG
jgi:hydrogenase nickel incorporation protein HypA/HybF